MVISLCCSSRAISKPRMEVSIENDCSENTFDSRDLGELMGRSKTLIGLRLERIGSAMEKGDGRAFDSNGLNRTVANINHVIAGLQMRTMVELSCLLGKVNDAGYVF